MPLDLKRLRRDLEEQGRRVAEDVARAKSSGAMAIVRAHLADIEQLKAEGATWVAIAAALARQGVALRDGRPLTGRHLTALIGSIQRQDEGRKKARARRSSRPDLADGTPQARRQPSDPASPRPAPGDESTVEAARPDQAHRTAEQLRREGLADLYELLKGNKP